jgi:hypothetical protein
MENFGSLRSVAEAETRRALRDRFRPQPKNNRRAFLSNRGNPYLSAVLFQTHWIVSASIVILSPPAYKFRLSKPLSANAVVSLPTGLQPCSGQAGR